MIAGVSSQSVEELFSNYLKEYFTNRNFDYILEIFSNNTFGYGTEYDEVAYDYEHFIALYKRDLEQVPTEICYKIKKQHINMPNSYVAIIGCELDFSMKIANQEVNLNNARLSMVFVHNDSDWKVEHQHLSFASQVCELGEAYPIKELEDRNKVLERLVEQRTKQLNSTLLELHKLASTDALTGISNRSTIDAFLEKELSFAKRHKSSLALAVIDIDDFKNINDTYGHLAGDSVIKDVAAILKDEIRVDNLLGRWGGEEFIVIAPHTDKEGMQTLLERMRQKIQNHTFSIESQVYASFGYTLFTDNDTSQTIVHRADQALYSAKRSGKNCVIFNQ